MSFSSHQVGLEVSEPAKSCLSLAESLYSAESLESAQSLDGEGLSIKLRGWEGPLLIKVRASGAWPGALGGSTPRPSVQSEPGQVLAEVRAEVSAQLGRFPGQPALDRRREAAAGGLQPGTAGGRHCGFSTR